MFLTVTPGESEALVLNFVRESMKIIREVTLHEYFPISAWFGSWAKETACCNVSFPQKHFTLQCSSSLASCLVEPHVYILLGDETGSHVYIPKDCEPFGSKGFSCFSGREEDSVWLMSIPSIISEFLFCGAKQNKNQKTPFVQAGFTWLSPMALKGEGRAKGNWCGYCFK